MGTVPALKQSGKRTFQRASLTPIGAARLRAKLWMPVLTAVRTNPWQALVRLGLPRLAVHCACHFFPAFLRAAGRGLPLA